MPFRSPWAPFSPPIDCCLIKAPQHLPPAAPSIHAPWNQPTKKIMNYGKSDHYEGEQGAKYFAYQKNWASLGNKIDSIKFSPYLSQNDKVLDFGCGGGWLLSHLKCSKKVGIELNEAAHESCRSNGVEVYKSINEVPYKDFDTIISHHCLEHVPYPIEALSSLRNLLKPGGKLILIVPIDDWRRQHDFTGEDLDHHLHTWTPRLLANTLSEAGYQIQSVKVLTHAWFRYWDKFYGKIPDGLFHLLCRFWGAFRKFRQIVAVATNS